MDLADFKNCCLRPPDPRRIASQGLTDHKQLQFCLKREVWIRTGATATTHNGNDAQRCDRAIPDSQEVLSFLDSVLLFDPEWVIHSPQLARLVHLLKGTSMHPISGTIQKRCCPSPSLLTPGPTTSHQWSARLLAGAVLLAHLGTEEELRKIIQLANDSVCMGCVLLCTASHDQWRQWCSRHETETAEKVFLSLITQLDGRASRRRQTAYASTCAADVDVDLVMASGILLEILCTPKAHENIARLSRYMTQPVTLPPDRHQAAHVCYSHEQTVEVSPKPSEGQDGEIKGVQRAILECMETKSEDGSGDGDILEETGRSTEKANRLGEATLESQLSNEETFSPEKWTVGHGKSTSFALMRLMSTSFPNFRVPVHVFSETFYMVQVSLCVRVGVHICACSWPMLHVCIQTSEKMAHGLRRRGETMRPLKRFQDGCALRLDEVFHCVHCNRSLCTHNIRRDDRDDGVNKRQNEIYAYECHGARSNDDAGQGRYEMLCCTLTADSVLPTITHTYC